MNVRSPHTLAALALFVAGAALADARGDAIKAFDTRQDRVALGLLQAAAKAAPMIRDRNNRCSCQ
jgi:hypothetical protein